MKLRCLKCIYTAKFQMYKKMYKIKVKNFFYIQINVEKNAMILLNMTKPPVGGGKCLF